MPGQRSPANTDPWVISYRGTKYVMVIRVQPGFAASRPATYFLPNTSSKFRRKPLLYGQGCSLSFSYISMVVQLAAMSWPCMARKPARLSAKAPLVMLTMNTSGALLGQGGQQGERNKVEAGAVMQVVLSQCKQVGT